MNKTASQIGDIVLEKLAKPRWLKEMMREAPELGGYVRNARKAWRKGDKIDALKSSDEVAGALREGSPAAQQFKRLAPDLDISFGAVRRVGAGDVGPLSQTVGDIRRGSLIQGADDYARAMMDRKEQLLQNVRTRELNRHSV